MIVCITFLLCLLGPSLSNATCGRRPVGARITGGHTAVPHSWPWQLSLRKEGKHICGATLITNEWAVTAAHCLKDKKAQYSVMAGGHHKRNKDNRGTIIAISQIVSHSGYDQSRHPDIGIVKLAEPVKFTATVSPACLPDQGHIVTPGLNCYISGWGMMDRGRLPKNLQQAKVPVISHQQCSKRHTVHERDMICIGGAGSSLCLGDSGGPLVCEEEGLWVLRGAASFVWGADCPVDKYSVYARVSSQIDWIKANIRAPPPPTKIPGTSRPPTQPVGCVDNKEDCRRFVTFCKWNPSIRKLCRKSCKAC